MTRFKSIFITQEVFNEACEFIRPIVELKAQQTGRKGAVILLLDPSAVPGETSFEKVPYMQTPEEGFGVSGEDYDKYHGVAGKKAKFSYNHRKDSSEIANNPGVLQDGDTHWPGAVIIDGLIVSTSGLDWWDDVFISRTFAAFILARMQQIGASLREERIPFVKPGCLDEKE